MLCILQKRLVVVTAVLAVFVAVWGTWRHVANHLFGFAPSATGGTRTETNRAIRFAFDGIVQPDGLPRPWQQRVIFGQLNCTVFAYRNGEKAIRLTCDRSHFVLWYEAMPFQARQYPIIKWSWEADQLPLRGDVRTHAELPVIGNNRNDKALQLMVGFEGNYVLNYVWDANAPVGYECDEFSPVATVKTEVIDSGPPSPGQWRQHRVDVEADFLRRFGKPPGKILGVGISANTNHTAAIGVGAVSEIQAIASDLYQPLTQHKP